MSYQSWSSCCTLSSSDGNRNDNVLKKKQPIEVWSKIHPTLGVAFLRSDRSERLSSLREELPDSMIFLLV